MNTFLLIDDRRLQTCTSSCFRETEKNTYPEDKDCITSLPLRNQEFTFSL